MWSEHLFDSGMRTEKLQPHTALLFILSLQTCAFNLSKHYERALSLSLPFLQGHYKTMLFVLHISYELAIPPIPVPVHGGVSDAWSHSLGPSFPPVSVRAPWLLLYFKLLLLALSEPK